MAGDDRYERLANRLAEWLRGHVERTGARGLVVGLSGGIDSAVVLGLARRATPGAVAGVIMPCHSAPEDEAHGRLVATHFDTPVVRVDLAEPYDRLLAGLEGASAGLPADATADAGAADDDRQPSDDDRGPSGDARARLAQVNVKPRLRMTTLYYVANVLSYLVAGTGNRSELSIGYYTKYGDGGVDLLPIGGLLKSQVRALARALDVPAAIIDKPPSAGLWPGQTDEQEMGFGYDELEAYLTGGPETVPPPVAERITQLVEGSAHKRAPAPVPDLAP